jgi:hypothetical protein
MTEQELITRREAIMRVTAILGGVALVGGSNLLAGCRSSEPNTDAPFTTDEVAYLDEIADTILPRTTTPGAKDAKTGAFMALIVTDSYDPNDRKAFREGMRTIDANTKKAYGKGFMQATPQQRLAILAAADKEQKALSDAKRDKRQKELKAQIVSAQTQQPSQTAAEINPAPAITGEPPAHYFKMMKELTLLGYFTSEIGATQAQRYIESPGRYDPCLPYTPGEKAWSGHA